MARVFSNVIGNLSGKLGNLSARITYGQTILAARPANVNVPNDAAALERRAKFLASIKFAYQVASLPALKAIWEKVKPVGISAFNQVVGVNYQKASANGPTAQNIITPDGFGLIVTNPLLDGEKLTATVPALNTMTVVDPAEVHCSFNAVVVYHSPLVEGDDPYSIIRLSLDVPNYTFDAQYNLTINFNVLQKGIAARYDSAILFLAVAPKTAEEKILQNSATFVSAF